MGSFLGADPFWCGLIHNITTAVKANKKMHNLHFIIQYSYCSNINNICNINNKIPFLFNATELQYASIPVSRLDYDIWWLNKWH